MAGGTFYRTVNDPDDGGFTENGPATVSSFRLDKYLVTVGRYRQFVNAWSAGWMPPVGSGKHSHLNGSQGVRGFVDDAGVAYEPGWVASDDTYVSPAKDALQCPWGTAGVSGGEKLPITCVNWYEAYAFCTWDGGFLPTNTEWQYAAMGGDEQRDYPWGSTDPGKASQYAIYNCYYPNGSALCGRAPGYIAPVGWPTLGAGRWGQLDLVGEVYQWDLDHYWLGSTDPCTDCAALTPMKIGPTLDPSREAAGGAYNSWALIWSAREGGGYPTGADDSMGFRCARTP